MNANEILDLPMGENDADAKTVREYLIALLLTLWREGERFDGKRPFGDGSWWYDLYEPLVKAGVVKGKLDSDGLVQEMDTKKADRLIEEAILSLACGGKAVPPASQQTGESK